MTSLFIYGKRGFANSGRRFGGCCFGWAFRGFSGQPLDFPERVGSANPPLESWGQQPLVSVVMPNHHFFQSLLQLLNEPHPKTHKSEPGCKLMTLAQEKLDKDRLPAPMVRRKASDEKRLIAFRGWPPQFSPALGLPPVLDPVVLKKKCRMGPNFRGEVVPCNG